MRACKVAVIGLTLAGVAACGRPDAAVDLTPRTSASVAPAAATAPPEFDRKYAFDSGVQVTVSQPSRFVPSSAAYPHAAHAVKLDVTVHNAGTADFDASRLSVVATTGGGQARPLVDAPQGVSGMTVDDPQLAAGRDLRLTVGFAVPARRTPITVTVRPSADQPGVASFTGAG